MKGSRLLFIANHGNETGSTELLPSKRRNASGSQSVTQGLRASPVGPLLESDP